MKIRIVSDGRSHSARVENAATGEIIHDIRAVNWFASIDDNGVADVEVSLSAIPINAVGEDPELDDGNWAYVECSFCKRDIPTVMLDGRARHFHDDDECLAAREDSKSVEAKEGGKL